MNYDLKNLPERTTKPRQYGFTMAMDRGLSLRESEDFVSVCSNHVDIVKLGWGTSFVTPNLKEKLKIFLNKNKSILHIAPENILSKKMLEFGFTEYVCGDLFLEGYDYPKYVKNIDVSNIPYPDNTFDLIICNHVLEHIPRDLNAMRELRRVLKIGGQAILQVPISKNSSQTFEDFSVVDPQQREIIFGQFDHVRIYGQDYVKRLEDSGFTVRRINISKEFIKYGLNIDEDIFTCEK